MPDILVYTDGACLGNPGPGGWGVRILYPDGTVRELGGREASTTNNRMELQGALAALQAIEAGAAAIVYSDSQYVINGLTKWLPGWKRKGWVTASRTPVKNRDLWMQLDAENPGRVKWRHVRGHSGDPGNDRADEIASGFAAGKPPDLADGEAGSNAAPAAAKAPACSIRQSGGRRPHPRRRTRRRIAGAGKTTHKPKPASAPCASSPTSAPGMVLNFRHNH